MPMPNGDRAAADIVKLTEYCLSPTHPRGRHKARVFATVLGLGADEAEILQRALLEAAASVEASEGERDSYGQRYVVDFMMSGPAGGAMVRRAWIVRRGEDFPRFVSCYVR